LPIISTKSLIFLLEYITSISILSVSFLFVLVLSDNAWTAAKIYYFASSYVVKSKCKKNLIAVDRHGLHNKTETKSWNWKYDLFRL